MYQPRLPMGRIKPILQGTKHIASLLCNGQDSALLWVHLPTATQFVSQIASYLNWHHTYSYIHAYSCMECGNVWFDLAATFQHAYTTGTCWVLHIHQDSLSQYDLWLSQATAAQSVGWALEQRVQVRSSWVSMVFQESTQQRSMFLCLEFDSILGGSNKYMTKK